MEQIHDVLGDIDLVNQPGAFVQDEKVCAIVCNMVTRFEGTVTKELMVSVLGIVFNFMGLLTLVHCNPFPSPPLISSESQCCDRPLPNEPP